MPRLYDTGVQRYAGDITRWVGQPFEVVTESEAASYVAAGWATRESPAESEVGRPGALLLAQNPAAGFARFAPPVLPSGELHPLVQESVANGQDAGQPIAVPADGQVYLVDMATGQVSPSDAVLPDGPLPAPAPAPAPQEAPESTPAPEEAPSA